MSDLYKKSDITCPKYLYMYFSNIDYAINNIYNSEFYLNVPDNFNDIFDSAFSINDNNISQIAFTEAAIEGIVKYTHRDYKDRVKDILIKNLNYDKKIDYAFDILIKNDIPKMIVLDIKKHMFHFLSNVKTSNIRVACFSELNDSILMWSHYGNNLKGVCLRFNTTNDAKLRNNVHKVNYTTKRINTDGHNGYEIYFTKSIEWSYEQEWRLVAEQSDVFMHTTAIDAVIIGEKIDITKFGQLTLFAEEKGIKIYRARPDENEYKINIIEDRF